MKEASVATLISDQAEVRPNLFLEKKWGGLLLTNQGKDPESENYNCEYIGLSNFVKQLLQIDPNTGILGDFNILLILLNRFTLQRIK